MEVPAYLAQRLEAQYGAQTAQRIVQGYGAQRAVTLRVNALKTDVQAVRAALDAQGIRTQTVPWYADALIVCGAREDALTRLDFYARGEIYLQSLSSMIPPLVLGAAPEDDVLDMAAAPGGKTTQIAALTGNRAMITACEMNSIRAERLRYNVERQGASRVTVMETDARRLDDLFRFDAILLDAPCSGSGTVQLAGARTRARFTKEILDKAAGRQEALLIKALTLLRPGRAMVYSTCSVLAQENEQVVSCALRRANAEIEPIDMTAFAGVPVLPVSLPGTLCVCPDERYEGFFVARIRRKKA